MSAALTLLPFVGSSAFTSTPSCQLVMTQDNFNITEYISNGTKWYSHQQMEYLWQPVKENYCTTAQYTQISETRITVRNVANHNGVNGEVVVSDEQLDALGGLCGEIVDIDDPAKLLVGPCDLTPPVGYGPYWVIAAGPSPDNYEWALISVGQPNLAGTDGCITGTGDNDGGLWIFTRSPVRNDTVVQQVSRNPALEPSSMRWEPFNE
uniref:Ecp2 effector protein domain-containing protein n=1 Tax=Chrysotila carterae TaxID=13221 RepID=A0A7S4B5I5_CHRCT